MRQNLTVLASLLVLAVGCGGKPLESKDELTSTFAFAAVPMAAAKGSALRAMQSGALPEEPLPEPAISVKGSQGGEAVIKLNPVGVVVGLAGKGIMVDVEYKAYSEDGLHWLDGDVSVLTQFDYQPGPAEADYADVKIGLVGELGIAGIIRDVLELNVALTTRFQDLSLREESISFRVDGTVDTPTQQFAWDQEDLKVVWEEARKQAEQR